MTHEEARQIAAELVIRRAGISYSVPEDMKELTKTILDIFERGLRAGTTYKPPPGTIETFKENGITVTICH